MLLPATSAEQAGALAERLRRAICARAIVTEAGAVRVSASFGAAALCPGESLDGLVDRADRALYAAKEAGRNRVSINPLPR